MLKSNKGITLVALVITIIVLLILAGVTLSLIWNGGIIDKAQNAVDTYSDKAVNENDILTHFEKIFGNYLQNINPSSPASH